MQRPLGLRTAHQRCVAIRQGVLVIANGVPDSWPGTMCLPSPVISGTVGCIDQRSGGPQTA